MSDDPEKSIMTFLLTASVRDFVAPQNQLSRIFTGHWHAVQTGEYNLRC